MKVTDIQPQVANQGRVNVFVDGEYRFSLHIYQVTDLGVKVGKEYSEDELKAFETESDFGKLYARSLEYCLMRPHSAKEIRDYLWRKTKPSLRKDGTKKPGVSQDVADRVFDRLKEKNYIDDNSFARYWVENRNQTKGTSRRKLINELRVKGVDMSIIEQNMSAVGRKDEDELAKIIARKRDKYSDDQKLTRYLARLGFGYEDIKSALTN